MQRLLSAANIVGNVQDSTRLLASNGRGAEARDLSEIGVYNPKGRLVAVGGRGFGGIEPSRRGVGAVVLLIEVVVGGGDALVAGRRSRRPAE